MALDIPALVDAGLVKAWNAMASVLTSATVRDVPTVTARNPATEAETVTWAVNQSLQAFLYDAEDTPNETGDVQAMDTALGVLKKMAIVRHRDFSPAVAELTARAELLEGANAWKVAGVHNVPAQSIFILTLRR